MTERPLRKGFRKGLARCSACGKVCRQDKAPVHPETKECLVRVTHARYAERGWRTVGAKWASIIVEALGPERMERAPGSIIPGMGRDVDRVHDGYFVPHEAAAAIEALAHVRLKPSVRREMVRIMFENPSLCAALDTVRRLDGKLAKWIRETIASYGNAEPFDIVGEPMEQLVHKTRPGYTIFEDEDGLA